MSDKAAEIAETIALALPGKARHVPYALRVIEELRLGVADKSEPKHGV